MIVLLNRVVDWIENILVTLLILTATVVAIAQVIARYVFNNSLYWSEELILYSLITMSFLTMGMACAMLRTSASRRSMPSPALGWPESSRSGPRASAWSLPAC